MNKNELDIILKEGEGYKIEFKENAPLPKITYTNTHFYILFKPSHEYIRLSISENYDTLKTVEETTHKTTHKTTPKTTQKIIEIISKNPHITRKEMAEIIGITEDGIKYHLNIMQKIGLIKRVGPKKGGYWQIIDNNLEINE
jgi:ATP-dependent DNA helicase RecG